MYTLSQLIIYPVKSLAPLTLSQHPLDQFGLQGDRRWMLVDAESGHFLSQRVLPEMCRLSAEPVAQGLRLSDAQGDCVLVPLPNGGLTRRVTVWEFQGEVWDAGDEVAQWLQQKLTRACRLVYFPNHLIRPVDPNYTQAGDLTAFSDGFPLLLISQPSLDDLNQRLSHPVTITRFRPNLVVSADQPFAEDNWRLIRIGGVILRVVKPCSRCNIPNINPLNAESHPEVMQVLAGYRKWNNKVYFGQNVTVVQPGSLQVGMDVEVLEFQ